MWIAITAGAVVAVVVIAVVSALTGGQVTSTTTPNSKLVGEHVGYFDLSGLNGGHVAAPWKEHHASVLIFFASWCGPCQGEMPKVAAYVRMHNPSPVEVVGIDANDERTAAQKFVKKDGVTFPVGFDAEGDVTSGVFGFGQLPETVFVNAKGVVTQVYFGAIPRAQLAAGITALAA